MKALMVLSFTIPGNTLPYELAEFMLDFGDCPTPRVGEGLFIEDVDCVVTGITTGFYRYDKRPPRKVPQPDYTIYLNTHEPEPTDSTAYMERMSVSLHQCPNVSELEINGA